MRLILEGLTRQRQSHRAISPALLPLQSNKGCTILILTHPDQPLFSLPPPISLSRVFSPGAGARAGAGAFIYALSIPYVRTMPPARYPSGADILKPIFFPTTTAVLSSALYNAQKLGAQ